MRIPLLPLPPLCIIALLALGACPPPPASGDDDDDDDQGSEGEGEGEGDGPPGSPATTILAPADGAFLLVGATTTFSCSAIDEQDGQVQNASIRWAASLDGDLGTGATVQNALVSLGDQEIVCSATDSDGQRGSDTVLVHVVESLPPTVTITAPADGAFVGAAQTVTFLGSAVDADGAPVDNASLRWLDGGAQLGIGGAVSTALAVGDHVIALEATDSAGTVGRAEITVHVVDNVPPACAIASPAEGAALAVGQSVQFTASCANADGLAVANADVRWASDVDGELGVGLTVQNALTTLGAHVITVCAADPDDAAVQGCDSISVNVANNAPPAVTIAQPAAGATFPACSDVSLACSASDPEGQGVSVLWSDSAGGAIPSGGFVDWRPTSGGAHTLTCTATDSQGASASATVAVTIATPVVEIQQPNDGDNLSRFQPITLRGAGCDAALGDLAGAQLQWSSSVDGSLGSGEQVSGSGLSVGTHVITLTASNGAQTASASITITID